MAGASAGHMVKSARSYNLSKFKFKSANHIGVNALTGRTINKSAEARSMTNANKARLKSNEAKRKARSAASKQGAVLRNSKSQSLSDLKGVIKARSANAKAQSQAKKANARAKQASQAVMARKQRLLNANGKANARKKKQKSNNG